MSTAVSTPPEATTRPAPLADVKVLDFGWAIAGAVSGGMLAQLGATVVRIESMTALDFNRESPPFVPGDGWIGNRSAFWANVGNAGKLGFSLNLKHPRRHEVTEHLVRWADVVSENFPGGRMARYGLGYDDLRALRPDLIMVSASMYGQTGPFASLRGNGAALASQSGVSQLTGWADGPVRHPGFVYSDFFVPKFVTLAVLAALDQRRRTGQGQYLDVAQLETSFGLLAPAILAQGADGRELQRQGNREADAVPSGLFRCQGELRWCAITVLDDAQWRGLCAAINEPWILDERLQTLAGRHAREDWIEAQLTAWTSTRDAHHVMHHLQRHGVPAGVLQHGGDLLSNEQMAARGYYIRHDHPTLGHFAYSGLPAKFEGSPCRVGRSPLLGEHTRHVCLDLLGMPQDQYDSLAQDGVFE